MSALFNSSVWYRVAALRPGLRNHVDIQRHVYRDELWYVIHDPSSGRQHRFPVAAQAVISLMDGARTVQEIWDTIDGDDSAHDGTQEPVTQDQVIQLLSQLHAADLLSVPIPPDKLNCCGAGRRGGGTASADASSIRWRCASRCSIRTGCSHDYCLRSAGHSDHSGC